MKRIEILSLLIAGLFLLMNCKKDSSPDPDPVIYHPTPYELIIPPGFPYMVIPDDNPATLEGIQLGRMLYYDPIIDIGNERACGQCHVQETSFSSDINSLPHINLAWMNAYLWNGKVEGVLENIMLFEVEHFFQFPKDIETTDFQCLLIILACYSP